MRKIALSMLICASVLFYQISTTVVLADQSPSQLINAAPVNTAKNWQSIAHANISSAEMPTAFLEGIDVYVFNSTVHENTHQFQISVALPKSYAKNTDQRYPVLYALDANAAFGIMTETARLLAIGEAIPEIVVVGIGFPVGGRFLPTLDRRRFDYTPTVLTSEEEQKRVRFPADQFGGGGPKLLEFMRQQLIPFIEQKYRVKADDRAIYGHSLGGLFTAYALFQPNRLFQRYIISSPSFLWDNWMLFKHEEQYAKTHNALPAKIFVSAAENEPYGQAQADFDTFVAALKQHNYKDLDWTAHIFADETHLSVMPSIVSRGLQVIYRK